MMEHEHSWKLSWFGFHVQEECGCGAYRTTLYDPGPNDSSEWEVTEPTREVI